MSFTLLHIDSKNCMALFWEYLTLHMSFSQKIYDEPYVINNFFVNFFFKLLWIEKIKSTSSVEDPSNTLYVDTRRHNLYCMVKEKSPENI